MIKLTTGMKAIAVGLGASGLAAAHVWFSQTA